MSNWTHVAAIFRVDHLRFESEIDFKEVFGKEFRYTSSDKKKEDAEKHPEKYLPYGSEGSLYRTVWKNPKKSSVAAYTVSVFGDLREHDSEDEIIDWFYDKCKSLHIRQAVIIAENELGGIKTAKYDWHDAEI